ncbi:MAG: GNAT family N-acetyltransferase [Beijerinckiaceae bacterium]
MWPWRGRPVAIEPIAADDVSAMAAIHAEGFARAWGVAEMEALVADRACLGHAARAQGWPARVDGFVLSRMAGDEAEILTIAVRRAQQGRGIAGAMLLHHLGGLGQHGVRALFLEVEDTNRPAIALYRRNGFVQVGQRPSYYRKPDGTAANAIVMKRVLG